tara:strand:- start:409 stop:897 length:489 start_codon:yes stop_codon:yes gene_type:complete
MNTKVTSNTKKAVVKKTVNQLVKRVLTDAQKQAQAKKRALNPQFANVQSAKRKVEKNAYKTNALLCLLEVKRTAKLENVNTKSHENIAYQNECKKAINFLTAEKNKGKFLPLLVKAVRTYKGAFVVYYFEQLIQSLVKHQIDKGLDFETSLKAIISAKLINA